MADPPRDPRIPDLVSLHEAAEILGYTRQYTHRIVMRGELRGARIGTTWVFRRTAVEKYRKARDEED